MRQGNPLFYVSEITKHRNETPALENQSQGKA